MATKEEKEKKVVEHALESAESCMLHQNYGRAFAHYLLVLKLAPEKKDEIKENFTFSLREWSEQLEASGRIEDLFKCYEQGCELFPECETMLNNMGAQLFKLGYIDEAAWCFRRAVKLNPEFLGARENLENVCSHLVERWHFRMLNDVRRNQAFRDAIHRAVSRGHESVLDIGTGTGLLSMFAVEAGAKEVFGCEMSKTMFETACDVVAANQMEDRIKLIHNKSSDLVIPEDLQKRVSLVITETFDAGLLGEQVLATLHNAWQKLLINQPEIKGEIIPGGATVYLCAIECEFIRKHNRLLYPCLRYLDLSDVNIVCKTGMEVTEDDDLDPYTTERLAQVPGGYKILTKVETVLTFNFNDPQEISKYVAGLAGSLRFSVTQQGRLDALAMWFDLELDDADKLTSDPGSHSCWEQAVYPVLASHIQGAKENLFVKVGDTLSVCWKCQDSSLCFKCSCIDRAVHLNTDTTLTTASGVNASTWDQAAGGILWNSPPYSSHSNKIPRAEVVHLCSSPVHYLERWELARLNDIDFNTALCNTLEKIHSAQNCGGDLSVVDLTQAFSLIGLQALKLGAEAVWIREDSPANQMLLCNLAMTNQVDVSRIEFGQEDLEKCERKWTVLLTELVEPCGCLRQRVLEDIALARVTCLKPDGVIVPHSAVVHAMVVESISLVKDGRVLDTDSTLGYIVDPFINDFQMTTHVDICLSTLDYKKLSDPFELFTFNFNEETHDDVPSYLDQKMTFNLPAVDSGKTMAVVYWFHMMLCEGTKVCTQDHKHHWKQAAVIQRQPVSVSPGTTMVITAACKNSCIDVKVATK